MHVSMWLVTVESFYVCMKKKSVDLIPVKKYMQQFRIFSRFPQSHFN